MMKKILIFLFVIGLTVNAYAVKEYATRFGTGTALEVYSPNNNPTLNDLSDVNTSGVITNDTLVYNGATWGVGAGTTYPGAGIPLSTGSAWGTSITNNSTNWNTAYTDRLKWDGGATGLTAATGRTSLELGTMSTQAASNVSITGGSITGITDLAIADGGTGNTQGIGTLNTNRFMIGATDFTTSGGQNAGLPTWVMSSILSGTNPITNVGNPNHPGIATLKSSTSANSGCGYVTSATVFLLAGGEATELIFVVASGLSTTTCKFGFMNTYTITAPVDGAWINIANLVLDGRTSSNSTSSTTDTTYTLTVNTWYHIKIVLNSDATLVTYTLYSEAGETLWTNTLATNIPTTTGRDVGHAVLATDAGTTATALMNLDFMNLYIDRNLVR